jgi:SpoVK/Ycf46/Vps4 family AAA+-type ATPase
MKRMPCSANAHDRYANIEISYLLQKMEEYQGTSIMASNLKNNIDEAFLRRLNFIVEFPIPDEDQRERIWRQMFPKELPRHDDIDVKFLAKRFDISGGNIRNIVLSAAFLAASESTPVHMSHLIVATKRELDKIGKLTSESDFGPYWKTILKRL